MPNALCELFDLSFPKTLWGKHHTYSHFIDEKSEAQQN